MTSDRDDNEEERNAYPADCLLSSDEEEKRCLILLQARRDRLNVLCDSRV